MSRFGSWLRGPAKASALAHTQSLNAAEETLYLEEALASASLIMEDDLEGAEASLYKGNSSFHRLGRGVTIFMRALLGFEQDIMKAASERLAEAENSTWADMKRAQKERGGYQSKIYPPGTVFALCYSEAMLMSAVIGVLNENLTESIKGFYKLRKAFITLDGIMAIEHKYMMELGSMNGSSSTSLSNRAEVNHVPGAFDDTFVDVESTTTTRNASPTTLGDKTIDENTHAKGHANSPDNDDSDLEFVDADEAHSGVQTPANYLGHVTTNEEIEKELKDLSIDFKNTHEYPEPLASDSDTFMGRQDIKLAADFEIFSGIVDVFVHSGTTLCYGLLLLIISMVPPAFSKLLSIIGFKGDRDRGIRMLWQSTRAQNINGAVAGLVLLGYYNGLLGFSDILQADSDPSDDNFIGFPKARCQALLTDMRTRHPKSRLWRLEEARMLSNDRNIEEAIEVLKINEDSPMKQIKAINIWELSLNSMWIHDYELCSQSFVRCIKYNSWSKSLSIYMAGTAHVEMYRDLRESNPEAAVVHKEKARELLEKSPSLIGKSKKRFMSKPLPFEVYLIRKVQKWTERSKDLQVDFVDAIGVSPLEEMIYLWNGGKRMKISELQTSLGNLGWQRTMHPEKHAADLDESTIQALLRSTTLRNMGRYDEARKELKDNILQHSLLDFKGHLKDDWTLPSAHYEMAVIAWFELDLPGVDTKAKATECEEWLHKVSNWESYVLDTRIGLKITTAVETLKMFQLQHHPEP